MDRRQFLFAGMSAGAGTLAPQLGHGSGHGVAGESQAGAPSELHPGVWRFRMGTPEPFSHVSTRLYAPDQRGLARLPAMNACPVHVEAQATSRGCLITIPLTADEAVYGLGLQMKSVMQRGSKKLLRVNADPVVDSGDAHAAPPFYVTTGGYGVLVDTARYATFYSGSNDAAAHPQPELPETSGAIEGDLPTAYKRLGLAAISQMQVEVPRAEGIDIYVFGGPGMLEAVQRYNLFSGGGALPPRWGLGVWYRMNSKYTQAQAGALARRLREEQIPCDVLGLEPGWHSHSYSCSYVWSNLFPDPAGLIKELSGDNYHLNLWEHAFVHQSSPLHGPLLHKSADYQVWKGLVPDFLDQETRTTFADFHEQEHVALGVAGYKLDECDNSDFTGGWSFPEISRFPSGADGEQMHSLFGLQYQRTIQSIFEKRNLRTYGLARSSGALAAPSPYVLYSDLYNHRDFVRALVNSSFSGLLWTPEVRDASSAEDLLCRLGSAVFSPMALINAWNIERPPWQSSLPQSTRDQSPADLKALETACRSLLELRMRMLPFLHAAFVKYHHEGVPPFRALVLDYAEDRNTFAIDDQYLMGDNILVAPQFAGEPTRRVYLPEGRWTNFWTGRSYQGKQTIEIAADVLHIPLFVKEGTLLPLARPTLHSADRESWILEVRAYGRGAKSCVLYEVADTLSSEPTPVELRWDEGAEAGHIVSPKSTRYAVEAWRMADV